VRNIDREMQPFVGFSTSLWISVSVFSMALWIGRVLEVPHGLASSLLIPTAMFQLFAGLFLTIARHKAVTQVLGYLVIENGIFIFDIACIPHQPLVIEMGILLDIFVAVFIMGIEVFNISNEFDHMDVDALASLNDRDFADPANEQLP